MTLKEIQESIQSGRKVYWKQKNYQVIKDRIGQYLIECQNNGSCVSLTDSKGFLTDNETAFFTVQGE